MQFNKELINKFANGATEFIRKNSPHILTGTAVVGVFVTSFFAVKGVIKAKDILEVEKMNRKARLIRDCQDSNLYPENNNYPPDELICQQTEMTKKEKIKLIWKPLLPAVISGLSTCGCIVGSDVINTGRNAALLAVATASSKALEEYQKKNIKLFGEKADDKILNEKAKDAVQKHDIPDDDIILKTNTGDMIILDEWCGRYFKGSRDAIDKVVNSLNYDIYESGGAFNNGYVSLNDFYDNIGIAEKLQDGDNMGWDRHHPILIDYRSALKDDEIPVLVLSFKNMPLPSYALDKLR